jgi:serine protease
VTVGLSVLPSDSHAQVSPALARKAPDAAEIVATATKKGYVRIIAEFTGPVPASEIRPDSAQLASVKARIAAMQDAIIASHFGSAANPRPGRGFQRGLLRFDISPMFAVNVTKTELEALAADPRIVRIHFDRLNRPSLLQSVPLIGMPNAYQSGATGAGQAVAILDTGVQPNHEFLSGKVVKEACFSNSGGGGMGVSLCPNRQPSQTGSGAANTTTGACINGASTLCEHGTHVAGIAAGKNTNPGGGKPSNGVAREAKIIAVQVFTRFDDPTVCPFSSAPCLLASDSDLILALDWVFQNALTPAAGVKLASANMSLGGGLFTTACDTNPLKPSIDNLRGTGVVTAIAAGNDGFTTAIGSPACISTAVAVGSSDKQDVISSFTNMASMVKLMGPGGFGGNGGQPCLFGANNPDILSSIAGNSPAQTGRYDCFAGTSMATPHVAGAFAAIRTACPNATVDQILTALQSTGKPITDTRPGGTQTKPRIQVNLALPLICSQAASADLQLVLACTPTPVRAGSPAFCNIQVRNFGPSAAQNVTVTDAIVGTTSFTVTGITGASCAPAAPVGPTGSTVLTCNLGTIAAGGGTSINVVFAGLNAGVVNDTATAASTTPDPNAGNNSGSASVSFLHRGLRQ